MNKNKENKMSTLIRVLILSWSAALLTASYAGALSKMDPTFIATVFTASAATFGINTMKKGGEDDDDHHRESEAKREVVIEPPTPEPVWEEPAPTPVKDSSLEERVEALEVKAEGSDGEQGEGFVTPRTGA